MKLKANFGKAADKYSQFRPIYPTILFEKIFSAINSSNFNLAIDIGSGTGLSSIPLAQNFERVISFEPDFDMYSELNENLKKYREKISTENMLIENYNSEINNVDLITFGTAFYWTDGPEVLKKIDELLKGNGVLAVYRYDFPIAMPIEIHNIIEFESNEYWDEFRHERLRDTQYSDRTIRESNLFSEVTTTYIENKIELTVEEIIGFFSSTSYMSAFLRSINDPKEYVENLINKIKSKMDTNSCLVDFQVELIIAKK